MARAARSACSVVPKTTVYTAPRVRCRRAKGLASKLLCSLTARGHHRMSHLHQKGSAAPEQHDRLAVDPADHGVRGKRGGRRHAGRLLWERFGEKRRRTVYEASGWGTIPASRPPGTPDAGKSLVDFSASCVLGRASVVPSTAAASGGRLLEPARATGGTLQIHGPLAQLVAHLHDAQGVTGSSPVRPTGKEQVRGHFCAHASWGSIRRSQFQRSLCSVGYVRTSEVIRVTRSASVRWNESAQRWMAWVRFPDGSRRKVERVERRDAVADLNELLAQRSPVG